MSGAGPVVQVEPGRLEDAPLTLIESAVRSALRAEGAHGAEVSVALLTDSEIGELHQRYLGKDGPTDVLAFSLGDAEAPVGDVYIGFEQAARQATDHGVALAEELARLAIHGTLHVLGHEHPEGPERGESAMFRLQERLVQAVLADRGGR